MPEPPQGWQRPFEQPIPLPGGATLVTLADAADYIQRLPKAEHELEAWQTAIATLIRAAEGREPLMHARIGMMQALNRDRPKPQPAPRRKKARAYRIIPAKIA